ncbi:Gfo/Idh/MocA family oxidoreductase [Microbacterium oryzae]|uniref:Gfo/Idh/MocA family protein n=1 Tax=Microbacterium oryzae TaxID=743009 RepID=UPI0025AFF8DD|nr:Gfo/Idh/MocA family oxidoreductase [Microbacterium oryzae]MDN3310098.1 Gfo/Idh/MocA family oxidoreductase [Microbacterium oryzae]
MHSDRTSADRAQPVSLAVVGAGWRARFILRVAAALPERFRIAGLVVRDAAAAERMSAEWGAPAFATLDALLAHRRPDFLVLSVPRAAAPELIADAVRRDLPVLTETPPADSLDDLTALFRTVGGEAPVQVAEQYHLQPLIAAQLGIARSGVLGEVRECRVSISHGYHAASVMRRMLGVGFEDAVIAASRFDAPLVGGPGRGGDPEREELLTAELTLAHVDFGGRLGVYDWAPQQNRSWIRGTRLLVRGERGEIDGLDVRYLQDARTPMEYRIRRVEAGQFTNLEGHFLRGLTGGGEWLYRNPFAPAPLIDDEIAVAHCLARMAEYVRGGDGWYGLAEAAQDHYLGMAVARAAESGERVRTTRQAWAA